ncbi:hypothetical protein ACX0G9_15870 [Flavitalea flava]
MHNVNKDLLITVLTKENENLKELNHLREEQLKICGRQDDIFKQLKTETKQRDEIANNLIKCLNDQIHSLEQTLQLRELLCNELIKQLEKMGLNVEEYKAAELSKTR